MMAGVTALNMIISTHHTNNIKRENYHPWLLGSIFCADRFDGGDVKTVRFYLQDNQHAPGQAIN